METHDSNYHRDWLRIAEKDYARVTTLLSLDDPEAAGFYLQQAVEKFLKAFLLSNGWRLKRIHDLEVLLNDALDFDPDLEEYRDPIHMITGFYFVDRYPLVLETGLTSEDVRQSLKQIEGIVNQIRTRLVF